MSNNFGDKSNFDYLFDALAKDFPGLRNLSPETSIYQFSTTPIGADWQTGSDAKAYAAANKISENLDGFYTPGSNFDQAYISLVYALDAPNATSDPEYKSLMKKITDIDQQMPGLLQNLRNAYLDWAENNDGENGVATKTQDEWAAGNDGLAYQQPINTLQTKRNQLTTELANLSSRIDDPQMRYIKALKDNVMKVRMPDGGQITVPRVSIGGNLPNDVSNWDDYPADKFDLDVTINRRSVIKYPWQKIYSSKVKHHCLSTSVQTSINVSRMIADASFQLVFQAKGAGTYTINRGQWYDETILNPKTVKLSPTSNQTIESLFGVNGPLHLAPETLLVLYQPHMKLTTTEKLFKQEISGKLNSNIDWIDIFSFRISTEAAASLQPVPGANNTVTVEIPLPGDQTPQIFGATSKVCFSG